MCSLLLKILSIKFNICLTIRLLFLELFCTECILAGDNVLYSFTLTHVTVIMYRINICITKQMTALYILFISLLEQSKCYLFVIGLELVNTL